MFEELKLNVAKWRTKGGKWQERRSKTQAGDISDSFCKKAKILSFILMAIGNQGMARADLHF